MQPRPPFIPWTNLPYALVPNGSTLDYVANAPYRGRLGVMKSSFVNSLYAIGCGTATTFCTTTKPAWDLGKADQLLNQGPPYGSYLRYFLHQDSTYHSSYGINHSEPPAPLLIANGWTDDLFPVDEALRYYNRTTTQYPTTPISLYFADWGHPRAQNKAADLSRYVAAVHRWINYYVKDQGSKPFQGVRALTETCPASAKSGGPYRAANWADLQPGEVRLNSAAPQTILPTAGSPTIGATFNPITANACATAPGATQPGTATYQLDVNHAFTMLGSPTVIADFTLPGVTSEVAARLLDVAPRRAGDTDRPRALEPAGLYRAGAPGVPATSRRMAVRGRAHDQARTAAQRRPLRSSVQRPAERDHLTPPAAAAERGSSRRRRRAGQKAARQSPPARIQARTGVRTTAIASADD